MNISINTSKALEEGRDGFENRSVDDARRGLCLVVVSFIFGCFAINDVCLVNAGGPKIVNEDCRNSRRVGMRARR